MIKRFAVLVAALAALAAGLTAGATVAQADAATAVTNLSYSITPTGVVANNSAARAAALNPPLNNWQFDFSSSVGNTERMLCIKDYTPETTAWNPKYTASDWSNASPHFHMWWDDMNSFSGDVTCSTYDQYQTINLYSYSGGPSAGCGDIDLTISTTRRIIRATIWLNRTADPATCYANATMRQNMTTRTVGYVLGLNWTSWGETVMATPPSTRSVIGSTQYADKVSIYEQYRDS